MGRNAAELRAAATATGWFDGPHRFYVGDGHSIPWQTGGTAPYRKYSILALWKQYLDDRGGEFARLHDWLYTPYGPNLIGATQEEADLALREEWSHVDPISGEVVYQACSTFGAPYFGVSPVGYVQPPLPTGGHDMGPASTESEGPVADFKAVIVFQQTTSGTTSEPSLNYVTTPRTGGWTESLWYANLSLQDVLIILKGTRASGLPSVLPARARVLNSNARILGVRMYEVGNGRGAFYPAAYTGGSSAGDQPSVALLCASAPSGTVSTRRFTIRGVPDTMVTDGEFAPVSTYTQALKSYFDSLTRSSIRGRTSGPSIDVFSITTAGLVTARTPMTFVVGNILQVRMTLDSNGKKVSGEFSVAEIGPQQNQLRLAAWTAGATKGGKIGTTTAAWFNLVAGETSAVRITNKKIGRPSAGYRGRKSRAKKAV